MKEKILFLISNYFKKPNNKYINITHLFLEIKIINKMKKFQAKKKWKNNIIITY